jgi:hypothetical protein
MWLTSVLAALPGCEGASAGPDVTRAVTSPGFWDHWGDGQAEISSYTLRTPRYGELRQGSAVLIFVTEDFTDGQRVKSDGGHDSSKKYWDEYPVLKLNEIRHFQTGVYDYDLMTSTFVRLDGQAPIGQPVKVSFSAQEWCGHTYEQLLPRGGSLQHTGHSYFDGEADHDRKLALPADGVLGEALPVLARGLVGQWPAPGSPLQVPVLDTLMRSRFAHESPQWRQATVKRAASPSSVTVPMGTFEVVEVTVQSGSLTSTWQVEATPPHRIVRFTTSEGEVGELVASQRMPYWQLNREGDEQRLTELGLTGLGLAP